MLSFFDAGVSSPMGSPQNWTDIVVSPFLFAFFGVMIYIGSVRYEQTYDKNATWWKWCFAPMAVALLLGLQRLSFYVFDFAYLQTVVTNKQKYAHFLGLIVPLLCVVSIFLYRWLKQRNHGRRVY
jgi:hypothetical protein